MSGLKDIYNSVDRITVKPVYFYSNDVNWFACEIIIVIGEDTTLEVVDVIHINDNGLIESIKAYKR